MTTNIKTIYTWNNGVPTSVTAIVNGKHYTADSTRTNWEQILKALKDNDATAFVNAVDVKTAFASYTEGKVSIVGNEVLYAGNRLDGVIVGRIFDFLKGGFPVRPILKFINNLYANPSNRAISELYKFLEHKALPITENGTFLAYKGLNSDFYSVTAGTIKKLVRGVVREDGRIFNGVGQVVECQRNEVDDNKDNTCSHGLHAGSMEYATTFGSKTVIVEINPADVVSIPSDCNGQKLRTYKYKVISEYERPLDGVYFDCPELTDEPETDGSAPEYTEIAEFDYTKLDGSNEVYTIGIVEEGDDYIEGYDLNDDKQYKRFVLSRVYDLDHYTIDEYEDMFGPLDADEKAQEDAPKAKVSQPYIKRDANGRFTS